MHKKIQHILPLLLTLLVSVTTKSQNTMTPKLTIKSIASAEELDAQPSYPVACVNWADYPYDPGTTFKIARLGNDLLLRFTVNESSPRAVNDNDFEPVWEDSCVEFFCQVPGHKDYYNFEFNSKGTAVASSRTGQTENVNFLSSDKMKSIVRKGNVGSDSWNMELTIPINLIVENPTYPLELKGNFYKCGDKCATPHFLSWAPIDHPTPLFHCPKYFGTLVIE